MIKTFEEFKEFYFRYGKTPGMMAVPKNSLNNRQLLTKFEKYIKLQDRSKAKALEPKKGTRSDEMWVEVVDLVAKRDGNQCRFLRLLSRHERDWFEKQYPYPIYNILDPAHIFPRSKSSNLYYDVDNVVLLNRVSHGFLDNYKHPLTGESISREERDNWWKKIIGEKAFNELEKLK